MGWKVNRTYDGHTYSIVWFDEDGEGLTLANDKDLRLIKKEPAKGGERWEGWLAATETAVMVQAIVKLNIHEEYGVGGTTDFEFSSYSKALRAIRAARQAWTDYKTKVLKIKPVGKKAAPKTPTKKEPAWMAQARKAGWTPPKTKKR